MKNAIRTLGALVAISLLGGGRVAAQGPFPDLTTTLFAGTPGTSGTTDETGPAARFFGSAGEMTTDGTYLWVGEGTVVRRVTIATGQVATVAGVQGPQAYQDNPVGLNARFGSAGALATDGTTVWIADAGNHVIRAMTVAPPHAVTTVAGTAGQNVFKDDIGPAAGLPDPRGFVYHGGFVYLTDASAAVIRRFDPATTEVVTLAGTPGVFGTGDGFGAAARFVSPRHMTARNGILYISDTNGAKIRTFNPATTEVRTLAGTGTPGYADGLPADVLVHRPRGIATDGASVYWAEYGRHTIRQVALATGVVDTVAGTPCPDPPGVTCTGGYGEGTGPTAVFNAPWGLVYHQASGSFFLYDGGNFVIRRLTPPALDYFTLAPCRVVDTRGGAPIGGPALVGQTTRTLAVAGNCGIPPTARAISINLAVTQPTATGNLRLFPGGQAVPTVSSINYGAGQTRGNNAIIPLNANGEMDAFVGQPAGTTVHLIVDVNGYFE